MPINAWLLWGIASLFFAYQYILRVMPSVLFDDIMQKFGMDAAIMGQFSGIYYIGYSIMHLPVGIMLDRLGPRKVMSACILLTISGLLPLVWVENWQWPIVGRMLMGMGSSAAILGVFKVVRVAFAENKFASMLSYSVVIGLMSAMCGGGPLAALSDMIGFDYVIYAAIALGLLIAILTFTLLPEIEVQHSTDIIADLKIVMLNKHLILFCLFSGFMIGPLEGFADTWGVEFLRSFHGLDKETAGYYTSIIFLGMCIGSPIVGWLTEKTGITTGFMVIAGAVMCLCFFSLMFFHLPSLIIMLVMGIIGICCSYQIIAIYKVSTLVPENVVGLATATANMIIMTFGYAFHSLIGMIAKSSDAGHSYSDHIFAAISVIPIALIIGTVGFTIMAIAEYSLRKVLQNR
jgi:predicted MFS family arabinose efflux permease